MSKMINSCDEMQEMFSSLLDGEIAGDDKARLEEHLLHCNTCEMEYQLWHQIAQTLRNDIVNEEPSSDFTAKVMQKIQEEAKPKRWIPGSLRTPAAAAAAAVMLFAGSWGVNVALQNDNLPGATNAKPGNGFTDKIARVIYKDNAETDKVAPTVKPGNSDNPQVAQNEPKNRNSEEKTVPSTTPDTVQTLRNPVLLNVAQQDVLSTILKLSVSNTADAKSTATSLATNLGGSAQVLTTQPKGAGELIIMRVTVPRSAGKHMVSQLSGLGAVIDRTDERKDISDGYSRAVNRLNEIQGRINANISAQERDQLEAEASGLNRQIESWNKEAGAYGIILWLEK